MRILYILLLGLFIFPFAASSQISVKRVDSQTNLGGKEGFFYSLPRMGVKINLTYEKTIKLKGPYSDYANEYLGLEDIIATNSTDYRIMEISIETFYLPDPEQLFFVEYNSKDAKDENEIRMSFSDNGFFVGSEQYQDGNDLFSEFYQEEKELSSEEIERFFEFLAEDNRYDKIDTIVKKITIDTITIDTYTFKTTTMEKYPVLKAREAVDNISKVRVSLYNLITGYQEVAYSEGTMRFMYDKLKKMETEYLDLFRGKIFSEQYTYSTVFVPKSEDHDKWIPVMNFSDEGGVSQQSGGENIYLKFTLTESTSALKEAETGGTASRGIFYRVPEYTSISVRYDQQSAELMQSLVPQFGVIVNAPLSAKDVSIYPETGNLRSATLKY